VLQPPLAASLVLLRSYLWRYGVRNWFFLDSPRTWVIYETVFYHLAAIVTAGQCFPMIFLFCRAAAGWV